MLRVGITGGIASGKSTAAGYFEEKGYPVVYADILAKKIMTEDSGLRDKLTSLLGPGAFHQNGTLNTGFIADIVFSTPTKKRELERIVHPAVLSRIGEFFSGLERKAAHAMAFVEAPLIFESKMNVLLDYVIAITAPEEIRVERAVKGTGMTEAEAMKRMKTQHSDDYFRVRSDFIIENGGDISKLYEKCAFIERMLLLTAT